MIRIKNARTHNLKGCDIEIPHNKFVVITGVSGSGKSSLAFDTLYAEGQRRYVESLSSYVRQFLGRMNKPEVDLIEGIPPAIAIEQKVINNNPRSTVGTTTEIYDYLKLLYARIGKTFSPISGKEVKHHTADDIIDYIVHLEDGTPVVLLILLKPERQKNGWGSLISQGFSRVMQGDKFIRISDIQNGKECVNGRKKLFLVIDRVSANGSNELRNRLYDSIQTAFFEGEQVCFVATQAGEKWQIKEFSTLFAADGIIFSEPTESMFAFNNPVGMCPTCQGIGRIFGTDPDLVIPDKTLSVYQGSIMPWRGALGKSQEDLILNAQKFSFPIHTPYYQLTEEEQDLLWTGNEYFKGLNDFFEELAQHKEKIQYRAMLARYRGKAVCPTCKGSRLRKEVRYVKVGGKSITELMNMEIKQLRLFFTELKLTASEYQTSERLLREINSRLEYLVEVGLDYLTLNRESNTLSGGESQRINLAKQLGSALVGSLYVLDEPSIGLHPRDTERLISVLRKLQKLGNTVVVVEHDEDIIRAADYIVDIGPNAGVNGGEVVLAANIKDLNKVNAPNSLTLKYLRQELNIETPTYTPRTANYINVSGILYHNIVNQDLKIPVGLLTVVTGVSGSGKSSMITDVLYNALLKHFTGQSNEQICYKSVGGSLHLINGVELINQTPIGRSSRSNPVTYTKAYDEIRKLFAKQPLAQTMGFTAGHFSFNTDGGRCPVCLGEGTVVIPMQFMADLVMPCEECGAKRFKKDILDVKYRDKNIYDVLEMTVDQAIAFFAQDTDSTAQAVVNRLMPLHDVGIGYIKLGQSSSTLSGGENQRVKLASFLTSSNAKPQLFIFDEPTTGLHTHDINTLLKSFRALIAHGHTVVIIEHNMHVIKCADYIIDMGPEGGNKGGKIIAQGTPKEICQVEESYTGQFLKSIIK